jgi:hypothetical protein
VQTAEEARKKGFSQVMPQNLIEREGIFSLIAGASQRTALTISLILIGLS